MIRYNLLLLIFTLASVMASGQSSSLEDNSTDWKSLNESNFLIKYPKDWDLSKSEQMGMSFMLFSRLTNQQDVFRENVNLIIQDLKGLEIDLDAFTDISVKQIRTLMTNGTIIDNQRLNSNGREFQRIIYTGDQGSYNLKFEQFYWIKNEKAYVLTLTCEKEQFEAYKYIGEKILNSFKLK